ncbi:MAG: DUF4339 domain-containing protein [Planctomycetaceae bacterium]|jgi:hypothetical protein|nr:DUF4339 domain-containing protein [Planctomycetaceae bacterium]
MAKWFYQLGKDEIGPISNFDLLQLVEQGVIEPETRIRKDDAQWVNASAVGGLFEALEVEIAKTVCPYCSAPVLQVPCRCPKCNRDVTVSVRTKLSEQKSAPNKETVIDRLSEIEKLNKEIEIEGESERVFIVLFAIASALLFPAIAGLFVALQSGSQTSAILTTAIVVLLLISSAWSFIRGKRKPPESV